MGALCSRALERDISSRWAPSMSGRGPLMVVLGCETRIGLLLVVRVSMVVAKGSSSTLGDRHAG
jgi:hypothetical protein